MKKILTLILVMLIGTFTLIGCTSVKEEIEDSKPANLKEITGKIIHATLNDEGNIVINKEEITEEVTYISYVYEGITIGLIAVKDSDGNIKVVINTCQSCGGSPYAYFVQVEDKIQCQNCGNTFAIHDLGTLVDGGCNPILVEDLNETNNEIIVGVEQLKGLKDKFENWKGPTE